MQRDLRHDSDVLVRQVDGHLATLRANEGSCAEIALAERIADALRTLVEDTTRSSAVDRARVRAAVHFFVARRNGRHHGAHHGIVHGLRCPLRSLTEDVRVVNEIVQVLGRPDLMVTLAPAPAAA